MNSGSILVFVYGTLKRGGRYHYLLENEKVRFRGKAVTREKFIMYERDGIPYVSRKRSLSRIKGEVYEVDKKTLFRLDSLEEHPHWYRREEVEVEFYDGNSTRAFLYFNENEEGRVISSGNFPV